MAAAFEEEWVRVLMVARIVLVSIQLAAYPLLVLDALVNDAIAEEEQVGGERKGPGAGDGCQLLEEGGENRRSEDISSRSILGMGTPRPMVELMMTDVVGEDGVEWKRRSRE